MVHSAEPTLRVVFYRTAVFFAEGDMMALVHGFIKKSQKTPKDDLALARRRAAELRRGG